MTNNKGMQATKPTWSLSADKKTYTKVYSANGTYKTPFIDIIGNITSISFSVNEIK